MSRFKSAGRERTGRSSARNRSLAVEQLEHRLLLSTLEYSTYLGGSASDVINSVAVDDAGAVYVAGDFRSKDFPEPDSGSNPKGNKENSFVAKFDPNIPSGGAQTLLWVNSLGRGQSTQLAVHVDAMSNSFIYVTGATVDASFLDKLGLVSGTTHNGGLDVYVIKLSPSGDPQAGTFLGGSSDDVPGSIAVDADGAAYVTGYTQSAAINFPTTPGALDPTHNGGEDGFVFKLSADLSALVYSTFLGGFDRDRGEDIAVDGPGYAYIAGRTMSDNFKDSATTDFRLPTEEDTGQDVFVTKLTPSGALDYSAILGGTGSDGFAAFHFHQGVGIAIDGGGNAYVSGETASVDFPTTEGVLYETFQGGCGCSSTNRDQDAFVTKINSLGNNLDYSTFVGGPSNEHTTDLAVDAAGNVYLIGSALEGFPTTPGAFDPDGSGNEGNWANGNGVHAQSSFVTKLDPDGKSLIDSTYLAGFDGDHGDAIAVDAGGNTYVVGRTLSDDFSTNGTIPPFDASHNGNWDGFLSKFSFAPTSDPPTITSTAVTTAIEDEPYTYDVEATDPDLGDVLTYSLDVAPGGMTINSTSGLIQWTPINAQVGVNSVTVRVEDQTFAFATQSFNVEVANVNDPPTIDSSPVTTATAEALYTYDVEATDPDVGDNLTYSLSLTPPAGMTIDSNTGLIQWTPSSVDLGTHSVTVVVKDVDLQSDSQNFSIEVTAAPTSTTYESGTIDLPIPDQNVTPSTLPVSDSFTIASVTLSTNITHARPSDLTVFLIHGVTTVELPNIGGGTVSAFNGQNVIGNWILEVHDNEKKKTGTLHDWQIEVESALPAAAATTLVGLPLPQANSSDERESAADTGGSTQSANADSQGTTVANQDDTVHRTALDTVIADSIFHTLEEEDMLPPLEDAIDVLFSEL